MTAGQTVLLNGVFQVLADHLHGLVFHVCDGRVGLDEDRPGLFQRGGGEALADATDKDVVVDLGLQREGRLGYGVNGGSGDLFQVTEALFNACGTTHLALA